jgi:hypothetical protein
MGKHKGLSAPSNDWRHPMGDDPNPWIPNARPFEALAGPGLLRGSPPQWLEETGELTPDDWDRIEEERAAGDCDYDKSANLPILEADQPLPSHDLPLPVELFDDIKPALTHRHLIKGLYLAGTKAVVFGQEGSAKTFVVLDQFFHIAAGRPWFGRKVEQGGVLYIAAEGSVGIRLRIEAWKREHGIPDGIPFAMIPASVDLLDPAAALAKLEQVIAFLTAFWGAPPVVIGIDTLSQTMGGGDENTSDMATYIANCGRLAAPIGCAIVIIHHQPLDAQTKRPRGHSSLAGAVDTMLHIEGRDGTRRLSIIKQKDLERGDDILFRLKQVEIGTDEEGKPVTSCVIEQADDMVVPDAGPRMSPTRRIVLDALDRATIREGFPPPPSIPDGVVGNLTGKVVSLSAWHVESLNSLATPDKNADSAARQFRRARDELQASKIIGVYDDYVWRNHT